MSCLRITPWLLTLLTLLLLGLHSHSHAQVERIISLAPSLTELVYSVGAGDKLVGVLAHSDYPSQAKQLPQVGDANSLNIERIIELRPDLILVWASGITARDLARLQAFGYNLLIRDTQRLDDIPDLIEEIGLLTQHGPQATAEAKRLRQQLTQLQDQYQHKSPVRVFYQIWQQPLITINGTQFMGQAIQLCGGLNPFADHAALAPHISLEAVLEANPQLILLGGGRQHQQAWFTFWQKIPHLSASQNQHIMPLQGTAYQRPTARLIDALPELCQLIDQARSPKEAK